MRETVSFLGQISRQYNTPGNREEYKLSKQRYVQAIKDHKQTANDNMIRTAKNPSKSMWGLINNQRGKNKQCKDAGIEPDVFNVFFSNIAHDLVNKIEDGGNSPLDYLVNLNINLNHSFTFGEVTFIEVRDVIDNLKNRNSTRHLSETRKTSKKSYNNSTRKIDQPVF